MSQSAPTYDLLMLLDPEADDAIRAKLVADARQAIEQEGELLRHDDWGERQLAYPIERKAAAEYHLLQFHAGTPALLSGLDRSLRIADGVLRFRIIKLRPGVPPAPDMRAGAGTRRAEAGQPAGTDAGAEPAPAGQPAGTDAGAEPAPEARSDAPAAGDRDTPAQPAPELETAAGEST